MIRSYFLLALVGTSVVAGNASEADKCASGDASCKGPVHGGGLDDQEVLLQSVMVHDKQAYAAHEDSAEDAAHEDSAEDGLSIAEKAMLEEEEKAALAEDDEEGKESLQSEANSKCKPCDTACLTKDNQESFVECDSDKNSKLTVQEVQACFHTTGAVLTELVSVTDAEAVQFVEQLDEDGDKELTQAEFSKSIQQCEASLVEEEQKETVISVTTIDCVDTKKVWKNFRQNVHNGCTKKQSKQSCSLLEEEEGTSGRRRRRRWGGGGRRRWVQAAVRAVQHVVRCVTNWVTVAFDCVKTVAKQVTKTVGQTFKDCWNKIKSQALGSLKDKAPFNSCSSANDCLKKLTTISIDVAGALQKKVGGVASQAGDVFKNILEDTGKKLVGVVDGMKAGGDSGLAQAQKTAKTLFDGLSGIASALAGAAVELAEAFIDFGQAAAKGIKANSNIGNRCTKSGYGFIYFAPTDCGAFSELASMSTNRLDLWPRKVANALAKFGQCFTKRAILGLPTPFLDRKMATMCVPQGVWTIIGGIVGTFRWAISQIKAGAAGCQNDEAPVCQLMNALTDMGNKLASKLGASFMQKSSELIGEKLHGNASRYAVASEDNKDGFAVKCVKGTGDFQMFFAASMAWKIIPFMDTYKAGIKITWGCGGGVYFTHVMFSLAMSLFLVGYFSDPSKYFVEENKFGFTIDVGFNVGTAGSKDIIQWMGGLSLSGAIGADDGTGTSSAGGGIAIAIKLLPNPDYPRGFATGPKLETTKSAALEEQWDEELEKAESPEESVHTNSKIMFKQIENTDVDEEKLLAAVEHGADSMMGRLQPGLICLPFCPNVCLQNIVLNAVVGVDFCITCGIMHGGSNGIISGPGDNQATSGTSYSLGPRRRRTRRRRDRRRRDRRRRDRRRRDRRRRASSGGLMAPGSVVGLKGGRNGRWCADEINLWRCNRGGIGQWERFTVHDAGGGRIALKGGRGHRWCADEHNRIRCNRGGIGQWEKFQVHKSGSWVGLKGGRDHRWCADEYNNVKCNRGGIGQWERFTVHTISGGGGSSDYGVTPGRTIAFKGGRNGRWCADEYNQWRCNRGGIGQWERFYVHDAGGGKRALRGGRNNRWCADEYNRIRCNRNGIGQWEKFQVVNAGGGRVALKGGRNHRYCADEYNNVKCNRGGIGQWEKFQIHNVR